MLFAKRIGDYSETVRQFPGRYERTKQFWLMKTRSAQGTIKKDLRWIYLSGIRVVVKQFVAEVSCRVVAVERSDIRDASAFFSEPVNCFGNAVATKITHRRAAERARDSAES